VTSSVIWFTFSAFGGLFRPRLTPKITGKQGERELGAGGAFLDPWAYFAPKESPKHRERKKIPEIKNEEMAQEAPK